LLSYKNREAGDFGGGADRYTFVNRFFIFPPVSMPDTHYSCWSISVWTVFAALCFVSLCVCPGLLTPFLLSPPPNQLICVCVFFSVGGGVTPKYVDEA
jgi:hypothetical protein